MNTCAAHCIKFVGTRARAAGIETLPAFDQFNVHKVRADGSYVYSDKDGAWISRALKITFDPKHADHFLVLDNMSLLTAPEHRHVMLDTALKHVTESQAPLWIIVNTAEAGASNSKSYHWVAFELDVELDPKSIKVFHRDSRINEARAQELQAVGHKLSEYCKTFLGWDGEGCFSAPGEGGGAI